MTEAQLPLKVALKLGLSFRVVLSWGIGSRPLDILSDLSVMRLPWEGA